MTFAVEGLHGNCFGGQEANTITSIQEIKAIVVQKCFIVSIQKIMDQGLEKYKKNVVRFVTWLLLFRDILGTQCSKSSV